MSLSSEATLQSSCWRLSDTVAAPDAENQSQNFKRSNKNPKAATVRERARGHWLTLRLWGSESVTRRKCTWTLAASPLKNSLIFLLYFIQLQKCYFMLDLGDMIISMNKLELHPYNFQRCRRYQENISGNHRKVIWSTNLKLCCKLKKLTSFINTKNRLFIYFWITWGVKYFIYLFNN